ncbi:MAG: hypothetical protein P8182_07505 [Deltaproteobacteria bacterium]
MDNLIDLINMGRVILDNGFDADTFLTWRHISFVCLLGLLGPLNYYTRTFCSFTRETAPQSLLAGEGILETARMAICEGQVLRESSRIFKPFKGHSKFVPWLSRKKHWFPLERLQSRPTA